MINNKIGQVYKVNSDSYAVKTDDELIKCGARGNIKKSGTGISVGDIVGLNGTTIEKVFPRESHFIRPNVSNVDTILAVISPEPKPDFYLLDKLLINAIKEDVEVILVVNKSDIEKTLYDKLYSEYVKLGVKVVSVSAKDGTGVERLKNMIKGRLCVLAGQSAAGKTSLVNSMLKLELKTGDLSNKILRGRHTTTKSEIFELDDIRLIDSPGFAVIDADVTIEELPLCYPDYYEVASECKFRGCAHINEPDCKVKELVSTGKLSQERYSRYVEIYKEIRDRRKTYEKD